MAFCGACGANLNGQAYCTACGAPAGKVIATMGDTSVIDAIPKSNQEISLEIMDEIDVYFNEVIVEYSSILTDTIKHNKWMRKPGLKLYFLAPVIWIAIIYSLYKLPALLRFINSHDLFAILFLSFSFLFPLIWPITAKMKKRKMLKYLSKQISKNSRTVAEHYASYNGKMPIGFEYFNPQSISEIKHMILSGRADTIDKALNLMKDDEHKSKMEAFAAAAAQNSAEAATYAKEAASSAKNAEFYASSTFWRS